MSARTGEVNYLASTITSSLRRNGAVLTRRDADGSDAGTEGVVVDKRLVDLLDGRSARPAPTLEANGFEVHYRLTDRRREDFLDHEAVAATYYDECEAIVREATGAGRVHAFDHNVRSASGKADAARIAGGQQVQGPAHVVHGDYTLTSAPQRLRQLSGPPTGNDTYVGRLGGRTSLVDGEEAAAALAGELRFAIVNVWRNIANEPVATRPLALCDGRSVAPEDLVVFEIHYADRIGENYFAKFAAGQRWYTWPGLVRDEALLIKQWDSAGALARSDGAVGDGAEDGPCTFSFHTAFKDPAAREDAPDRWSIEVRCMALYV
jgi:hypothetical protein